MNHPEPEPESEKSHEHTADPRTLERGRKLLIGVGVYVFLVNTITLIVIPLCRGDSEPPAGVGGLIAIVFIFMLIYSGLLRVHRWAGALLIGVPILVFSLGPSDPGAGFVSFLINLLLATLVVSGVILISSRSVNEFVNAQRHKYSQS